MAITTLQTPCFLRDVVDAVKLLLRVALDLSENHVIEMQEETIEGLTKIKAMNFENVVVVSDGGGSMPDHNGSGRLFQTFEFVCNVRLLTRRHTDINNQNVNWDTRHWAARIQILNAFQDRYLYDESPDLPNKESEPSGRQLSAWPMEATVENIPASKTQEDHSYGVTLIKIRIPFNILLTPTLQLLG